jgi:hypothetical protein
MTGNTIKKDEARFFRGAPEFDAELMPIGHSAVMMMVVHDDAGDGDDKTELEGVAGASDKSDDTGIQTKLITKT